VTDYAGLIVCGFNLAWCVHWNFHGAFNSVTVVVGSRISIVCFECNGIKEVQYLPTFVVFKKEGGKIKIEKQVGWKKDKNGAKIESLL